MVRKNPHAPLRWFRFALITPLVLPALAGAAGIRVQAGPVNVLPPGALGAAVGVAAPLSPLGSISNVPGMEPSLPSLAPLESISAGRAPEEAPAALGSVKNLGAASLKAADDGDYSKVQSASGKTFDQSQSKKEGSVNVGSVVSLSAADEPREDKGAKVSVPANQEAELRQFAGAWRDEQGRPVSVKVDRAAVRIDNPKGWYGHNYEAINQGVVEHPIWKGSWIAPGGTVRSRTETTFTDGRIVQRYYHDETHWLVPATRFLETRTMEIKDGKLVESVESKLYARRYFWFGDYDQETSINTTNIADPIQPVRTTVYTR